MVKTLRSTSAGYSISARRQSVGDIPCPTQREIRCQGQCHIPKLAPGVRPKALLVYHRQPLTMLLASRKIFEVSSTWPTGRVANYLYSKFSPRLKFSDPSSVPRLLSQAYQDTYSNHTQSAFILRRHWSKIGFRKPRETVKSIRRRK